MKICFKNAFNSAEILQLRKSDARLFIINFHNTMCFNMTVGIPSALRAARELSLITGADVVLHGRLDIEGDNFLSTLLIQKGELVGVSDCITNDMFTQGNALRIYNTDGVPFGISVDSDILSSGADNAFCVGARLIIHNTLKPLCREYFGAYKCHLRMTNGYYIGLFSDCALIGDGNLKLLPADCEYNADFPTRNYSQNRAFLKLSKG